MWQQRALTLCSGAASSLGDSWLAAADVDQLFASVDLPATNLDLADGSQPLPKTSYAPSGVIDRRRVLGLHREGATVIIRAAQRWSAKLRRLCAGLEWDFGFPAQANIYLTPAGRKSTPPHWDTHDLFIVQVAGNKNWRLFASDYDLPLDSQRFSEEVFTLGRLVEQINLNVGEVLYLPRGVIHEPVADSYSIHVSLGVLVSRWVDVLLNLVEAVGEDQRDLRLAVDLPMGQLDSATEAQLVEHLLLLVDLLRDRTGCEKAIRRHMESLLSRHGDSRERQLLRVMERRSSSSSSMKRTPSVYAWIESEEERLRVHWKRGAFSVPSHHAPFVSALLSGSTVGDAPPSGTEEERVALCEALVDDGFLECGDSSERGDS